MAIFSGSVSQSSGSERRTIGGAKCGASDTKWYNKRSTFEYTVSKSYSNRTWIIVINKSRQGGGTNVPPIFKIALKNYFTSIPSY